MAFTPFTADDQPTMAAFNEKFQSVLEDSESMMNEAVQEALTNSKVVYGSYIGTGTYGESNPNSLTFDRPPVFVWMVFAGDTNIIQRTPSGVFIMRNSYLTTEYVLGKGFINGSTSGYTKYYGKKSSDGKTFFWYVPKYATDDNQFIKEQMNIAGEKYEYLAFFE